MSLKIPVFLDESTMSDVYVKSVISFNTRFKVLKEVCWSTYESIPPKVIVVHSRIFAHHAYIGLLDSIVRDYLGIDIICMRNLLSNVLLRDLNDELRLNISIAHDIYEELKRESEDIVHDVISGVSSMAHSIIMSNIVDPVHIDFSSKEEVFEYESLSIFSRKENTKECVEY
jgi:hypothetical protein